MANFQFVKRVPDKLVTCNRADLQESPASFFSATAGHNSMAQGYYKKQDNNQMEQSNHLGYFGRSTAEEHDTKAN